MSDKIEIPDFEDSWAKVELFRWQYGSLPNMASQENRKLDISVGLNNMAIALESMFTSDSMDKMPTPSNVAAVLKYCAKQLKSK